jgi:hypothetical protein
LQLNPHEVPSQVAVAFAGGAHGVQEPPHVIVDMLLTQFAPH